MSPDEEQQLRALGQALEIVPGWVTLTSSPPQRLVAGSDLAYDDRRAIWMLESDDANERLLRRLRLEWAESSEQAQVRELMGAPLGKSKDDRLEKLTDLLPPATTDQDQINVKQKAIKKRPDYGTIVEAAGSHVSSGSSMQLFLWKTCSALAHGDFRGTLGYMEREVLPGPTPGIAMARITGSVSLLIYGSLVAIETIEVALKFYGKRAA